MIRYRKFLHISTRVLGWSGMLLGLAAVLLWAALQWVILDHVDRYRPDLERFFRQQAGVRVQIGAVRSVGFRWLPTVELDQVTVFDLLGHPGLHLDRIEGRLALWGFFQGRVDLEELLIDQPTLTLRRDPEGNWWLSGIPLPHPRAGPSPFLDWVLHQGRIRITHATLNWQDDLRSAPVVGFTQGELDLANHGSSHRLSLAFTPPAALAEPVRITANLSGAGTEWLGGWSGNASIKSNWVYLDRLKPWVATLGSLERGQGRVALEAELLGGGQWGMNAELDLRNLDGRIQPGLEPLAWGRVRGRIEFRQLDLGMAAVTRNLVVEDLQHQVLLPALNAQFTYGVRGGMLAIERVPLDRLAQLANALPLPAGFRQGLTRAGLGGTISQLDASWSGEPDHPRDFRIRLDCLACQGHWPGSQSGARKFNGHLEANRAEGRIQGDGVEVVLDLPQLFALPLHFHSLSAKAQWKNRGAETLLELAHLQWSNSDLSGQLSGSLSLGKGVPGVAHLQGGFEHFQLNALWRYFPLVVASGTRDWLRQSLLAGTGERGSFQLEGDLANFPFPQDRGGRLRVSAELNGGRLRFAPGWPELSAIDGRLELAGPTLTLQAANAQSNGLRVAVATVRSADLSGVNPSLEVQGEVVADTSAALNFLAHSPVSGYLGHVLDSFEGAGAGHLSLALQIPLNHPEQIRISGDYQFLDALLNGSHSGIPPLSGLQGHLVFTEWGVQAQELTAMVLGGPARLQWYTDGRGVHLVAEGMANLAELRHVYKHAILDDVAGKKSWRGEFMFGAHHTSVKVTSSLDYLGEPVQAQLTRLPQGGFELRLSGKTSPTALHKRYGLAQFQLLDAPLDWTGQLDFSSRRVESHIVGSGRLAGHNLKFELQEQSGVTQGSFQGQWDASLLKRMGYDRLAARVQGTAPWQASLLKRGARTEIELRSDLVGMALNYPRPLQKNRREALPVWARVEFENVGWRLDARLGQQLIGYRAEYSGLATSTEPRWRLLYFGAMPTVLPDSGFVVQGGLQGVDFDSWSTGWAALNPAGVVTRDSSAGSASVLRPDRIDLLFEKARWAGRIWKSEHLVAVPRADAGWDMVFTGAELSGSLEWTGSGAGDLRGHLKRVAVPEAAQEGATSEVMSANLNEVAQMPALDLVIDSFSTPGHEWGQFTLKGEPEPHGWHLTQYRFHTATGVLQGEGHWTADPWPETRVTVQMGASDLGKLLETTGYPHLIARGQGEAQGALRWWGNPEDFTWSNLSGTLDLELRQGQFSQVDPGDAGRLLGLLSLQTLPRRITLDFNDIFSAGFAFDNLTCKTRIKGGVMALQPFEMVGPAAKVGLTGQVDLVHETSSLEAKVDPAVGGSVALATTVVGGPVAGVVSYLVQKLLRNPLDHVLSYRYRIEGPWQDPQINPLSATP